MMSSKGARDRRWRNPVLVPAVSSSTESLVSKKAPAPFSATEPTGSGYPTTGSGHQTSSAPVAAVSPPRVDGAGADGRMVYSINSVSEIWINPGFDTLRATFDRKNTFPWPARGKKRILHKHATAARALGCIPLREYEEQQRAAQA